MDTKTTIPLAGAPLTLSGEKVTEAWFRFFLQLFNRTGGSEGGDLTIIKADVADLQAALAAAVQEGPQVLESFEPEVAGAAAMAALMAEIGEVRVQLQEVRHVVGRSDSMPGEVAAIHCVDSPPSDVFVHGDLAGGALHALATQTEAGFMSAADKLKLDSL
ncbi:hypothetical protein [Bordetella hinzii]|uniref:hypothetical protein n=1 Tax=Bordetella hinzii TaxID=103855 RepID=UPI0005181955|nr:hypothetical protein [Bordetella hinzii]